MDTDRRDVSAGWYLDLVGAPAAPPPADPTALPGANDTDAIPSASPPEVHMSTQPDDTQSDDDASGDALSGWTPAELAAPVARKRNFRISVLVAFGAVLAMVAAAVLLLPRLVERTADNEAANYRTAIADVRRQLPGAQTILATVTEPSTTTDELSALVPDLLALDVQSDALLAMASEPLPDTLPGLPRGALDDLEPIRQVMRRLSGDGSGIADRISAGLDYRGLLSRFLVVPDLPTSATSREVQDLSATLAASLADTTGALADLPDDPAFADHRAAASSAAARFSDWQSEYITALRANNEAAATALVLEMMELRNDLNAELVGALATLRRDVDGAILTLDAEAAQLVDTLTD